MKATLDCLECLMRQTLAAARVATDDPARQRRVLDAVSARIPSLNLNDSPSVVSLPAYEETIRCTGNPDPYREIKRAQNALAMELEAQLRETIRSSDDALLTALHISAAGNIIDLGTMHADNIDVRAAIEQVMEESFAVDHGEAFRKSLAKCEDLLFLLDNAGEIVFDKLLIEELLKQTKVTAVVKGGPIINDVLIEDAEQVGLTTVCDVIDNGGAFVGSPLSLIPESFRKRMEQADMIIGKGQGNYETVDVFPGDVFLILRAKCALVAEHMGIDYGQVGLISTRVRGY